MGSASRRGILFRDGGVLEALRKVDAVVLDKTGTITEGNFSVLDFEVCTQEEPAAVMMAAGKAPLDANSKFRTGSRQELAEFRKEVLSLAASVEQYSEHPLGKALVILASAEGTRLKAASSVEVLKGQGITGSVDGRHIVIGNRKLLADEGVSLDSCFEEQAQQWESQGKTVAFLGWNHELRGMAAFGDRIRTDAMDLVADLKRKGIVVYVVSGDSRATTRSVALQVGADHHQLA